jgi:hypothetical protein
MKLSILLLTLTLSSVSLAKETLLIEFSNGTVELSGNIEISEGGDGFLVDDVSLNLPDTKHGSLHLVSEFGWGDSPYNHLCEQISSIKFGKSTFRYATAYGYATTFSIFSGVFTSREFFIVNRDKSFEISDTYPNAVYDSGFACYDREFEY